MDTREIGEIRQAIRYMDYKPAMLSKFYDIKSLLLQEILQNEEAYKASTLFPNPGNDNKIVKCVNILEKKYMANRELIDCTKTPGALPEAAKTILGSVKTRTDACSVRLSFKQSIRASIYLNIPRSNRVTISSMQIDPETEFEVMNSYNAYYTEGFTLALHGNALAVAIEPSALDGIKGQGDVFVYALTEQAVYKDFGSRYFDCSDILSYYRG